MKLTKSPVIFNEQNHTYTLGEKSLSGITSLLSRQLFKDKYSGVDKDVLQAAAERGTFIHQCCELADDGFVCDEEEVLNYLSLKEAHNLAHEVSEYLVSDNEYYASCIDKVYREDDNTFSLGDIKTTYNLDKEYVQWQLSIYAYLFERQNPGAKVNKLFAIWLRGKTHKLVYVDRIPDSKIESLLQADSMGIQYQENLPSILNEAEKMIIGIETELKRLTEQKKALQEGVMKAMVKEGLYSWKGENVSITRKMETTRKTFDKESFEKDYPGIFEKYIKETPISGSVIFKINKT